MSHLEAFKLVENPFSITPPEIEKKIVWAGRQELKDQLTALVRNSIISTPSRINVNWGEWGAGKTHAMKYFSQKDVLRSISEDIIEGDIFSIRLTCPREAVINSLYISLINEIGLDEIQNCIETVTPGTKIAATQTRIQKLEEFGVSNLASKVFIKLASSSRAIRTAAERYLYLEASVSDIKKMDVPRRIKNKTEIMDFFGDLIQLLLAKYVRVFIWIDEMETIETLPGRDLSDIRFFIRNSMDIIPRRLTLVINATKKAEELSSYLTYLGAAVRERIYKITEIPTLRESDVCEYVKNLLNSPSYRTNDDSILLQSSGLEYFPFNEEAIIVLYGLLTTKLQREPTPRNINEALSSTLEYAFMDDVLLEGLRNLSNIISSDFIRSNWDLIGIGDTTI